MKHNIFLRGCAQLIGGIIQMLLPINLFWEKCDNVLNIIGYTLIFIGLVMLSKELHRFKISAAFAALSILLSLIVFLFEPGHLFAVLPLVSYCFVLYFMCTRFSNVADRIGEHHIAHHFISHMKIDIVATSVELLAHLFGIHGILFYFFVAAALYCETQLIIHIIRFYKKFNDYANYRVA